MLACSSAFELGNGELRTVTLKNVLKRKLIKVMFNYFQFFIIEHCDLLDINFLRLFISALL